MSFSVRVMIQGVGIYAPDEAGESMLVLFPGQGRAHEHGVPLEVPIAEGVAPVSQHQARVEFGEADLVRDAPNTWRSIDVTGQWLGFRSEPRRPPRLTEFGRVPGVPRLAEVLDSAGFGTLAGTSPAARPGASFDPELLSFGLYVDSGELSLAEEYKAAYRFFSGDRALDRGTSIYSSVLKLELGEVEAFEFLFHPLGDVASDPNVFRDPVDPCSISSLANGARLPDSPCGLRFDAPTFDDVEIWIRHFCGVGEPPNPNPENTAPGETDEDFVLNYALLERLGDLLDAANHLPVPRLATSWAGGEPSGGKPNKCAGSE